MKKDLIIYGAGGFGREIAWLVEQINQVKNIWNLLGYLDDDKDIKGKNINGYEVLGDFEWFNNYKNGIFTILAIGNPHHKKK